MRSVLALYICFVVLVVPLRQARAEGEAVNGYPNWAERVLLEWMNRARSDPQADLAGCPSGNCMEAACYNTQATPRYLDQNLEHSSRFHGDHMRINGYFSHPSECTLVSNIASLYPTSCSGAASCSCTQGALTTDTTTWTDPFARMQLFGATVSSAGEIIAEGYNGPVNTFYAWLYEPTSTSTCGFNEQNGHRFLLLSNGYGPAAGAGYTSTQNFAVMDFAGTASNSYKIPSGSHYPKQAATVDAWTNWYDSAGPSRARINVDGVCSNMSLGRGTVNNGAWHASVNGVGTGCHRYQFQFKDSAGNSVLYPTSGSLGIGDGSASCPDWNSTAPPACSPSPDFVALNPVRLMDTRTCQSCTTVDGLYQGGGPVASRSPFTLKVAGRGGTPATGVSAVALNLVAVDPTNVGNIKIWSGQGSVPASGNLNLNPGKTVPVLVISQVDANGNVAIYNDSDSTNQITVTLEGYFPAGSNYVPLIPERLMDTRGGPTVDGTNYPPLAGGGTLNMLATGRGSLPANGVGAAVLSATATSPTSPGFVAIWPTGQPNPQIGNLNLNPGNTLSNVAVAKIGSGGQVSFYNGSPDVVNLVANLQGWFSTTSDYSPIVPQRFLDTRSSGSTIDGAYLGSGPMQLGQAVDLQVTGRGSVPASGVSAVIVNFVSVNATSQGFLTMWPTGETQPALGNVNLNPGMTLPNAVIAKVGANGKISIYCGAVAGGQTDVVVNVLGYFRTP